MNLLFAVKSHKATEWIQNHLENVRGQLALPAVISIWELPGRHSVGGELGDH